MPQFSTKRRVRHAADDMFELVADMERYPEFVPLCQNMKVRRRTPLDGGGEVVISEMTVAYKMIRETFTTRVMLDRPHLNIFVEYLDGPFSWLENRWNFRATSERASEVEFFISYEFKSRILGLVMGAMFDTAFRRFSDAFERRADRIFAARKVQT